jgi:sigma-B regulation protein RsbU (phosphoserine phosphatase)
VTQGRRHVRLQAEIALARRLHDAFVPAIDERFGRYEVFARSWPVTKVGGDLVDAFDTHAVLYASVVDVSGHGVNTGALTGMIKAAVRTELRREPTLGQLLEALNDVLLPISQPGMFATAACLRLEPGDEEAALAGHPPILHWRAATREVERIDGANLPLALFPEQRYASRALDLEEGDLLVMLTDGLLEVLDAKQRELGLDEIVATVQREADQSLSDVHDRIIERAQRHGRQRDDQSLLLVRVLPS